MSDLKLVVSDTVIVFSSVTSEGAVVIVWLFDEGLPLFEVVVVWLFSELLVTVVANYMYYSQFTCMQGTLALNRAKRVSASRNKTRLRYFIVGKCT